MRADAAPSWVVLAALPEIGGRVRLPAAAARHLARACRARTGDTAHATDGRGGLATLRLEVGRSGVEGEVTALERSTRDRHARLLCGAPEGERADWLIEKLVELGVGRLVLVDCERAAWRAGAGRRRRWERLSEAALGQSLGRFGLAVEGPLPLARAVEELPPGGRLRVAEGDGGPAEPEPGPGEWVGVVGPAPGLSADERRRLREAGGRTIRLAPGRLRTETAAVAWACWWAAGSS